MICKKCHTDKQETEFLTGRDNKCLCICKECINKLINPDDPYTFMWILKELDIPYVEEYWKDRQEIKKCHEKPFTVGCYISFMKLRGFKDWRWSDSAEINQHIYNNQAWQGKINTFGKETTPFEL